MSDFPSEYLYRMVPLSIASLEVRSDGDGNELVGYGAVFNEDTVINGWEGHFVERIMHGAFRDTLDKNGSRVKMQFDHGMDARFGGAPIAVPVEFREDDKGLFVRGRFVETQAGQEVRELISSGAVDGMSFRFTVDRDQWDKSGKIPVRTIQAVTLYEVGPVTFPAYQATTVGVRNAEVLQLLRESGHFCDNSRLPDVVDADTSEVEPDTSSMLTPIGSHKKRVEQARRILGRRFPEIKEIA